MFEENFISSYPSICCESLVAGVTKCLAENRLLLPGYLRERGGVRPPHLPRAREEARSPASSNPTIGRFSLPYPWFFTIVHEGSFS